MAKHNELGQWGEQLAREHLIRLGYSIMEQNIHSGRKEIDLVATKGNRMVFVEVKTRSHSLDDALDAVDEKKIRRIVRAADSIMSRFTMPFEYQFDIIAVVGTPQAGHELHHFPDAFFPPLF